MAIQLLFDGTLNPLTGTLTNRFSGATGFYIDAPNISSEIEIDVFLQVYVVTQAGEQPRNLALGKLKDGVIALNQTDTETISLIPSEYLESGLDMAFFFIPSEAIELDIWIVLPDCNLCGIETRLTALSDRLNQRLNNIETTLGRILTAVNAPDIPIPVNASAGSINQLRILGIL